MPETPGTGTLETFQAEYVTIAEIRWIGPNCHSTVNDVSAIMDLRWTFAGRIPADFREHRIHQESVRAAEKPRAPVLFHSPAPAILNSHPGHHQLTH